MYKLFFNFWTVFLKSWNYQENIDLNTERARVLINGNRPLTVKEIKEDLGIPKKTTSFNTIKIPPAIFVCLPCQQLLAILKDNFKEWFRKW